MATCTANAVRLKKIVGICVGEGPGVGYCRAISLKVSIGMVVEGARRAVVEETILEEIRSPGFQLRLFCDQLLYFVINGFLFFFVVKASWSSNSPNSNGIFVVVVVVQVVQHRWEESTGAKITSFSSLFMCREQASTIVLLKTPPCCTGRLLTYTAAP